MQNFMDTIPPLDYGLTVDQIRSYVENEKHFTLEGLQYGLYKMLFTKEK